MTPLQVMDAWLARRRRNRLARAVRRHVPDENGNPCQCGGGDDCQWHKDLRASLAARDEG